MDITGLKNKIVVVTGAGQNIGREICLAFAKSGAHIVINGLNSREKIENVAEEVRSFGVEAFPVLADASNFYAIDEMVKQAVAKFGSIDISVANVGIRPRQKFEEISIEDWQHVVGVNLNAAFYLARAVLPYMRNQKWGRIIHMSGTDGQYGLKNRAHVVSAKHAIIGLSRALAAEYGPDGITANSIAPGWIDTERNPEWFPDIEQRIRKIEDDLPLRKIGTVEDVANACLYLASDMGKFITGQVIHLNGGEYI